MMARTLLAVLAGYAAWTAIWLGGNAMLFAPMSTVVASGERFDALGPLLGILSLSVVCSVAAGLTAASIARERASAAVLVTATLLLVTGIGVQIGMWYLMPMWYHLAFLGLIVPVCTAGGRLARRPSGNPS